MGYALGTKWDDNRIKSELKNVMAALGIDRMPSRTEMDSVTHNTALSNKVMKTGGIRYWAKELGLELKNSETTLGNNYEYIDMNLFTEKGYKVNKMTTKHPYDLFVNDHVKVDVKVSHYYHSNEFSYHTFGLGKKYQNCDIFICICLDDNDKVVKNLIIPSDFLIGQRQLSVGTNSTYDKLNNKSAYIDPSDSPSASLQALEE